MFCLVSGRYCPWPCLKLSLIWEFCSWWNWLVCFSYRFQRSRWDESYLPPSFWFQLRLSHLIRSVKGSSSVAVDFRSMKNPMFKACVWKQNSQNFGFLILEEALFFSRQEKAVKGFSEGRHAIWVMSSPYVILLQSRHCLLRPPFAIKLKWFSCERNVMLKLQSNHRKDLMHGIRWVD